MTNPVKAAARRLLYGPALAKWTHRYAEWRAAQGLEAPPATDENGLPIPDRFLITMVAGTIDWRYFLTAGEAALSTFAGLVDKHGGDFRGAGRVLDFGCGCGRLTRHAGAMTDAEVFGVDYNGRLVGWCAENLPGHFAKNNLTPPLAFPDGHFDVIWLLSVFTHLRIATQNDWLDEFYRVMAPGAFCLVTFHDEDHPNMGMTDISRDDLIRDGTALYNDRAEGSNYVSTFQTRDYARRQFARRFKVCDIIPSTENSIHQAIAVLRKTA